MPTMQDVRSQYPQYNDMSDGELAGKLHAKFYADIPRAEFDGKIGLVPQGSNLDGSQMEAIARAKANVAAGTRPEADPAHHPEIDAAPQFGGAAMNATAGLNDALYGIAGAPVDAMTGAINLGIRGVNAVAGTDAPTIDEPFGGSRSIGRAAGAVAAPLDPANTIAASPEDRIARGVGQGVAGTVLPAGLLGAATRAGMIGPSATAMGTRLLGGSGSVGAVAADAVVGGVSGAGGVAAQEVVPEQYGGLASLAGSLGAGGLAALATSLPGVVGRGLGMAREAAAPLTAGGRDRMAAEQLRAASSDPAALADRIETAPRNLVPGSQPTTGQLTGDMGLLSLERAAQTRDPVAFQDRRASQNTARRTALEGVGGDGSPESVSNALRTHLRSIETEADSAVDQASTLAAGGASAIGRGEAPEVAGTAMREALETARAAAKEKELALWSAVDPDGTLVTSANKVGSFARGMVKNRLASAKPPEGEEAAILDTLSQYGEAVPFAEMGAMRSRLSDAIRSERRTNGETQTYRRLSSMRSALEADLNAGISGKVAQENEAIAAGTMSIEDTIAAKLANERESYAGGRQALAGNSGSSAGPVGYAPGGMAPVPGLRGTAGEGQEGLGPTQSDPRLAGGEPNFDGAAAERLKAATTATRERADTFGNKTLGPIRRRPSTTAPYDMPAAAVPARIFSSKPGSVEAVRQFRTAVGDGAALPALEGYAIGNLRKTAMNEDGSLDFRKLAVWRRKYADVLRDFPALDARIGNAGQFAERLADVAADRASRLDAARSGALGKLLGVDDPADVSRVVGGLFGRQDSVAQISRLKSAVGGDKEGQAGLKRAAANFIANRLVSNTEAATTGQTILKSDQFQSFVKQNRPALGQIFDAKEVSIMEAIAADLNRSNRSLNAVRIPGQSNTAQDLTAVGRGDSPTSILMKIAAASGGVGTLAGLSSGGIAGVSATVASGLVLAMRQNGLKTVDDIVADALLNPDRAAMLLMKAPKDGNKALERSLAQRYRTSAAALFGTQAALGETEDQ